MCDRILVKSTACPTPSLKICSKYIQKPSKRDNPRSNTITIGNKTLINRVDQALDLKAFRTLRENMDGPQNLYRG